MDNSTQVLFKLIDQKLDNAAKDIRNQIFATYRDLPWTPEQRKRLDTLIQPQLETLILQIMKLFDNVGGVLPEGVSGWSIINSEDGTDISTDNADYADLWREFLLNKNDHQSE